MLKVLCCTRWLLLFVIDFSFALTQAQLQACVIIKWRRWTGRMYSSIQSASYSECIKLIKPPFSKIFNLRFIKWITTIRLHLLFSIKLVSSVIEHARRHSCRKWQRALIGCSPSFYLEWFCIINHVFIFVLLIFFHLLSTFIKGTDH